ncbi:UPF0262 family protein [uncultured Sphingomonas sp.]|uniref:UPF0262 family protein n=1 Tax=uncultured Sphingomonas sp. TaxID=158754 RepID=UPI0025E853C3|nr:UPF0262 family protein [uncultured Sphingomonas sp.]
MADPRIIAIELDGDTLPQRAADADRERVIAIHDLLAANRFEPRRPIANGYTGPYRVTLAVEEGRLVIVIADAGGQLLETIKLGLTRLRRTIRDYFAICDSYFQALGAQVQPTQMEPIDMARRGLHNQGAEMLMERLEGKVTLDFATARRLFTLITALHIRG